jgi:L-fucose isomerase-like protein
MFVAGSNMHHKFGQLAIDDWLYGEAKLFIPKLENYFSAIGALKKLSHSKIGLVGKTAYGFNNMTYGLNEAKEKYGFSTQNFDESELIQTATELSAERVDQTYKNLKLKKKNTFVDDKSIDHTIRLYIALKDLIEEHNLTSLAVSCWPTFQTEYEITPCVTLSLINDILSVPVSCEGDLMGVITMIVANELSHSTSMVFDIADILEDEEMLLLWHCGITTCSLMKTQLDDLSIINHPMINRMDKTKNKFGCSFDGLFKEQEVTALRLLNIEDKIFSVSGFVDNSYVKGFTGTRGWIKELSVQGKRKSIAEIIDSIMKNGVEHHLVVVPGNIDERLDIFSNLANLKILK